MPLSDRSKLSGQLPSSLAGCVMIPEENAREVYYQGLIFLPSKALNSDHYAEIKLPPPHPFYQNVIVV